VLVVVRVSSSSAAASASQADLLRDLQISQPAISPTTSTTSRVQPRAPNPWDSAAAGVPAADGVEVDVVASAAADVAGEVVGEVGGSTDVGGRVEVGAAVLGRDVAGATEVGVRVVVGVAAVVRVGRVGAVVSLGDSLQDSAGQPVEVVRRIRDEIHARVRQLLAELVPLEPDRPGLRRAL
jgi:hypothetical protein